MRLFQSSLRNAVILALGVGLLVPTSLVLMYDWQASRHTAMEDLRRDLGRTVEVLALSLSEPIWQVSAELAQPMIDAQTSDPRFVRVLVIEPNNAQPFIQMQRPDPDPDLTLTLTRPVTRDGREIAQLTVAMSAAPLLEAKQNEAWRALARSVGILTLSLVLILGVMQRRVLHPMDKLSRAAEELAAGRLDQPLELLGEDEIARVGIAMERMRQALLRAFEDLRGHASTLEDQVAQRTAELTSANNELTMALANLKTAQRELVESEKLASLGRLVAGVAHELNTPLGNAMTVVSALGDRWTKLDQMLADNTPMRRSQLEELVKDTRRGQDILQRNVQKAADLVRDFKQVAIDQTTDSRRDFDLSQVIEDVLVMVEPSFKHTPFKIVTDLARELEMSSYPGALGQVLTNLLMNALVHGFEGRDEGIVRVSCRPHGDDQVELVVEDDGRGMDASIVRKIFDPFFTTKLGKGGSGLGMHIVHNIVTNVLGGQIEVQSTPGQGSRMTMLMPRSAPLRSSAEDLITP
ncbi:HAMP domain-containing protein [Mitsuaria sp. WAJ17]|uniref:sensor histidine kinase n=1 Tax=Mitsuaria sp. WAJ17 TaxID=2761452 RepID=UPI001601E0DC|nr:ATP-binding protein [Mitsuaria sp. WAJ17]MBB2486886.1 HAMP domain-containing protein [Mitsuaria sp. WAJ17]